MELKEFLRETATTDINEKPTITRQYADTFNTVDRFNKLLMKIRYRPRVDEERIMILYGLIAMATVQSWSLAHDWNCMREFAKEHEYVRQFGIELAQHLSE